MEKLSGLIEKILRKKLSAYQNLIQVFRAEQDYIVNINVDALWETSAAKKKYASEIETLRAELLTILENNNIAHNLDVATFSLSSFVKQLPVSRQLKLGLHQLVLDIDIEKDALKRAASENRKYVLQYLGVVSDIMSTITAFGPGGIYSGKGVVKEKAGSRNLIRAEV